MLSEGYDAVIRHGPVDDERIIVKRLATSRRVLVASPEYLKRCGKPSSLPDLGRHAGILYSTVARMYFRSLRNIAHGPTIQYRRPFRTGWTTAGLTGKVCHMHRPPKTSKLADWRTGYALVIGCRTCKHSRRTEPHSLAKLLGWDVPLIVVTAKLRCSNCYAKDCEIQVDRMMQQRAVPKRLL
jgi:hypothetical protein